MLQMQIKSQFSRLYAYLRRGYVQPVLESPGRTAGRVMMPAYFEPDTSLPWFEQVLQLERQGKPTSPAAHDLAIEARAKRGQVEREPGSDDE